MRPTLRTFALAAVLVLGLTACPEDDPVMEEAEDDDDTEEPADADERETGSVVTGGNTDLGEVLVDGEGMTLYMFENDDQGDPTCYDDCEENWPPLLSQAQPLAVGQADNDLIGTVERDDGSMQVTYNDWPLYYWQGDENPGDTEGQGQGDVWWVIDIEGEPVREAAEEEE